MNFNLSGYTIALIAGGFGIIGALLGNWASHRFSDHRDRRKEFNEAADALARILTKEKVRPIPSAHIDFFSFQRVIEGRKLRNFNRAIELYEKAKKEQETNLCHDFITIGRDVKTFEWYHDPSSIQAEICKILEFTKRK